MSKRKESASTNIKEIRFVGNKEHIHDQIVHILDHEENSFVESNLRWGGFHIYQTIRDPIIQKHIYYTDSAVVEEKLIKFPTPNPYFSDILAESTKLGVDLTNIVLIYNHRLVKTETESISRVYYLQSYDINATKCPWNDDDEDEDDDSKEGVSIIPIIANIRRDKNIVKYFPIKDEQDHLMIRIPHMNILSRHARCRQLKVFNHQGEYVNGMKVGTTNKDQKDYIAALPKIPYIDNILSNGDDRKIMELPEDWLKNNQPIGTFLTFHSYGMKLYFLPSISQVLHQLPQSIFNVTNPGHRNRFLIRIEPYSDKITEMIAGEYHIGLTMVYVDTLRSN
jgi:hypothetical protein